MSVSIQRKARIKVQPGTTAPRSLWMTQLGPFWQFPNKYTKSTTYVIFSCSLPEFFWTRNVQWIETLQISCMINSFLNSYCWHFIIENFGHRKAAVTSAELWKPVQSSKTRDIKIMWEKIERGSYGCLFEDLQGSQKLLNSKHSIHTDCLGYSLITPWTVCPLPHPHDSNRWLLCR